jgi:tetratricopeptide (TPR) repeat protein
MKNIASKAFVASLLFASALSCSHLKSTDQSREFTAVEIESMNREALGQASDQLAKMVMKAKKNSDATTFLASDLFLKANMSLLESDYLTASVLFKHLVDLVPDDEFLQKKYAISLIRMNDLEAAQLVLENLHKTSTDEKIGLILAGVYTGLDKEKDARKVYQQLLLKNPKNEDACIFLGKSFALAKETKTSINLLQKCARNDPKNGMYDYYLGKIYLDQGNIPLAVAAFQKAYHRQPSLSQSVTTLGTIFEEKEQFQKAIELYRAHLKKFPQDEEVLPHMVQVLFLKERYSEVIPYAEKLSDLQPENLNLKVKLGILYTDAKKYPEAVSVFRDLLSNAPQSDKILYYLGAIYQEMKQYEASVEYFNQIPPSSALYTDSSVQMANMLSNLAQEEHHNKLTDGKWKTVFLKHVNSKLGEFKELQVEFNVIKAGFFEGVGDYKNAVDAVAIVQNEKSFSIQHKYYLANLYEKVRNFDGSTSLIMSIIENEPKNAHAWNFLGYSLLVRGEEMDRAYEYIQKALKISPNDGYIRDSLGWYYYKKGDVKRALTELQLAFKKVPDDIEILKHLAAIHKELKEFQKAKKYLETALKHARYFSDKQEISGQIADIESNRAPAAQVKND